MAGNKRKKEVSPGLDGEGAVYEYKVASGQVIRYKPLNPDLAQAVLEAYPDPEPPTREVATIDGSKEQIPDPNDAGYQERLREVSRERGRALQRLLVAQCLDDLELPEGWIERQKWILPGWEAPENELDRKLYWVQHWMLTNPADLVGLLNAAQFAAVLTPEEVEKQMANFRPQVARSIRESFAATVGAGDLHAGTGDDTGGAVGGDTLAGLPGDAEAPSGENSGGAPGGDGD